MTIADPNVLEAFMTDSSAVSDVSLEEAGPVVAVADPGCGDMSYTLLVPITVNGERITKVTLHLSDLGNIDDWGSGKLRANRDLLARLTGLHPAVLRALKWPDAEVVIKLFEAAVPAFVIREIGQETGQ